MVSVAPRKRTSASRLASPSAASTTPTMNAVKNATDTNRCARSSSPAPSAWLTFVPLPMPMVKATACMMPMAEKITPTAPEADVPIWLTKKVSAML